jgi:pimeloyl-ACP methyl ester carboxylesterase
MRRLVVIAISIFVLLTAATPISAAPATAAPTTPVSPAAAAPQGLRWRPCYPEFGPDFECAVARVPLDHDRPRDRTIGIAMVRLPASDPAHRLGSLFLNPGGPGGSGVDFVLQAGPFLYTDEVRARYDLIGFDPRGTNRSLPLLCFRNLDEALSVIWPFAFPFEPGEEAIAEQLDRALANACAERGGAIDDHMATGDVARDLEVLRRKVGDRQLNFVGYSYGSFLGVTYVSLFPDRVGRVVVDGVLDPIAWTTGRRDEAATQPFSTRLRSDAGAQATLDEFFRLCDLAGPEGCAFAGDSAARYAALAELLKQGPIEIIDPFTGEPFLLHYSDAIGSTLGAMYGSAGWQSFALLLSLIEQQASPAEIGEAMAAVEAEVGLSTGSLPEPRYPNFVEAFPGVSCSDSVNPDDHGYWSIAGAESDAQFGYFGRIWTWVSSICAVWQGFDQDRYLGPFDRETANPVLVVGTRYDPATRYEGALIVDELLPNSSLLTVDGWGHTSLFLSVCADEATAAYLLEGITPASGTVCSQDFDPFAVGAERSDGTVAQRQELRSEVMSEIAIFPVR